MENFKLIQCPICKKLPEITTRDVKIYVRETGEHCEGKAKTIECGCEYGASFSGINRTDEEMVTEWNRQIASATEPPKDYIDAEPCPYCGAKPEMTVSSLCYPFESFDFGCCQVFLEYSEDLVTHSIHISRHDKDELVPKWNELVALIKTGKQEGLRWNPELNVARNVVENPTSKAPIPKEVPSTDTVVASSVDNTSKQSLWKFFATIFRMWKNQNRKSSCPIQRRKTMLDCKNLIDDLVSDTLSLAHLKLEWQSLQAQLDGEMEFDDYSNQWEFVKGRMQMLKVCLQMIGIDVGVAEKIEAFIPNFIERYIKETMEEESTKCPHREVVRCHQRLDEECKAEVTKILAPLLQWCDMRERDKP